MAIRVPFLGFNPGIDVNSNPENFPGCADCIHMDGWQSNEKSSPESHWMVCWRKSPGYNPGQQLCFGAYHNCGGKFYESKTKFDLVEIAKYVNK